MIPGTWQVKPGSEGEWEEQIVNDDAEVPMMFHTLEGLKPETYYELKVSGYNMLGWSDDQEPSFVFRTASGRCRCCLCYAVVLCNKGCSI